MRLLGARLDDMLVVLRDAVGVAGLSCVVGLLVNLVHPDAIPFIADQEYQIFAPCPEPGGEVTPVPANAPVLWAQDTFVVDARSKQEFDAWHFRRPIHVPYDYLDKVFIGHLHSDHFGDLGDLWIGGVIGNRIKPLRVWGIFGDRISREVFPKREVLRLASSLRMTF